MKRVLVVGAALAAGVSAMVAFGEEAVPCAKTDIWSILFSLQVVWELVAIAGTAMLGWLFKAIASRVAATDSDKAVLKKVETAVTETYLLFVQKLKENNGSMSTEEAAQARAFALDRVKTLMSDAEVLAYGERRLSALIQMVVARMKKDKQ